MTIGVLAAAACSRARPQQGDLAQAVSWEEDVAPLFAANCTSCHSGSDPAGGYRTTSYLEALGPEGAPVAVAGDGNSLLLRTLDPAHADAVHAGVSSLSQTVRAWVVEGRLSFFRSQVHPGGILNPRDAEFHGTVLRGLAWNFGVCASCHGADFAGGKAGVSCTQCHAQGPTACDTCHGQPPDTGAHKAHIQGAVGKKLDCSDCHVKPARFDAPGHLTTADGKPKDQATITFGALASLAGPGRAAPPSFSGGTCSEVYCHGGTLPFARGTNFQPSWNGSAPCGSCHLLPPASHDPSSTACSACHPLSAGPGQTIVNPALHVDGVVQVGDNSGTCSACHGTPQSPAPPRDLSGNTSPSALGVGAHQAHLAGAHEISAPIACSACHQVPADVHSPGHIDHALPATVTFSGLAVNDGASPTWDRASATCSSTYCHGGGLKMAADTAFKLRKPNWTLGTSQAFCGSCHGLPPTTAAHAGVVFPDCNRCHSSTVAANGGIIVSGPPGARTSTHLNGVIDVTP
ncbi:MAG TPA: CxxxxCH/CxxCH domain-containing protein [Myxococcales bacterium]|nr:CxxxxCH/CxxCH domain-containing protein [Myxococcales bacterium]